MHEEKVKTLQKFGDSFLTCALEAGFVRKESMIMKNNVKAPDWIQIKTDGPLLESPGNSRKDKHA